MSVLWKMPIDSNSCSSKPLESTFRLSYRPCKRSPAWNISGFPPRCVRQEWNPKDPKPPKHPSSISNTSPKSSRSWKTSHPKKATQRNGSTGLQASLARTGQEYFAGDPNWWRLGPTDFVLQLRQVNGNWTKIFNPFWRHSTGYLDMVKRSAFDWILRTLRIFILQAEMESNPRPICHLDVSFK